MPQSAHLLIETRREQIFPVLEPEEIERLERFGERRSYVAGEPMVATGEIATGAFLILKGRVDVTQRGREGHSEPIVTHGPGSFMGELAQLSGRPSLVDAVATETAEAFVIPPRRLRDLMVEEAELGERIMRALILRRVALLDTGAGGPIIVGSADNTDVLRLEGFLTRNGHPHQRFDPQADPCAQTLIERFRIALANYRSFCVPMDGCFAIRATSNSPAASGSSSRSIRARLMTWSSSVPGLRGLPPRFMQDRRDCRCLC
jgi:thioredoxin reductase (NADPH)